MGTHEAQRAMRARTAIGAVLAAGAMLFIGPASIAVASPGPTTCDGCNSGPGGIGLNNPAFKLTETVMNEMSEMTSLRLQMTMDRRSKFLQTLSNVEKSISDTDQSIVSNLK